MQYYIFKCRTLQQQTSCVAGVMYCLEVLTACHLTDMSQLQSLQQLLHNVDRKEETAASELMCRRY